MPDTQPKPVLMPAPKKGQRERDTRMRHLRSPVNAKVSISLHTGGDPALKPKDAAGRTDPFAVLPEPMKRLRAMEPQVMKWLAASDANRLLFISDPVAAIQQVDKKLDKAFIKQLHRARQRLEEPKDSRVRLAEVRVTVVPAPASPPPKGDTKPAKK